MYTLYDFPDSGNGYKVRLLLAHLSLPYAYVPRDILAGETRTAEFLALNPNGRIPLLVLPDGTALAESNAILFYLAENTPFLSEDRVARAQTLQWMFFEQYSHEPNIAVMRFRHHYVDGWEELPDCEEKMAKGRAALDVMERHLSDRDWFAGDAYSIADIALYAYTHAAPEGGFDLSAFPAIGGWLARVAAEPGHVKITDIPA
jgi:glutathione S-transferase